MSTPGESKRRRARLKQRLTDDFDYYCEKPSIWHAVVIIFLEFYSWSLLTIIAVDVLSETFPQHTFLMNGLIQGVKGILSFLAAPLLGALSDEWGRRPFLIISVTMTCLPIPLIKISPWWYFAILTLSGIFNITFTIVFAYCSDITDYRSRHRAYGMVSATFASSIILGPATGVLIRKLYGDHAVVLLATAIAVLDVIFIIIAVPESHPEASKLNSSFSELMSSSKIWEKVDPFHSLKVVFRDVTMLFLCLLTLLAYIPEAGEYSAFFVYLRVALKMEESEIAAYMAVTAFLAVLAQTTLLPFLIARVGPHNTIIFGLSMEVIQLAWFSVASRKLFVWGAGVFASLSALTYPAISSYASTSTGKDQQGVAQGLLTGIRGLCNGLGPAMFGVIFYLFDVDLDETGQKVPGGIQVPPGSDVTGNMTMLPAPNDVDWADLRGVVQRFMPGPPFALGAALAFISLALALFMPRLTPVIEARLNSTSSDQGGDSAAATTVMGDVAGTSTAATSAVKQFRKSSRVSCCCQDINQKT